MPNSNDWAPAPFPMPPLPQFLFKPSPKLTPAPAMAPVSADALPPPPVEMYPPAFAPPPAFETADPAHKVVIGRVQPGAGRILQTIYYKLY